MRIVALIQKNPFRKAKFADFFLFFFFSWLFYTLFEQKFSNWRPLLSTTFPQGFRISKKFGHWTLGKGGKNTFKTSEQMQKTQQKTFFCPAILDDF